MSKMLLIFPNETSYLFLYNLLFITLNYKYFHRGVERMMIRILMQLIIILSILTIVYTDYKNDNKLGKIDYIMAICLIISTICTFIG